MWPLDCSKAFSFISPSNLVFDPMSASFLISPDIIGIDVLTTFHAYWIINVTSTVYDSFCIN